MNIGASLPRVRRSRFTARAFRGPALLLAVLFFQFSMLFAGPPSGKRLLLFVGSNTLGEHAVPELAKAYFEQVKKAKSVAIQQDGEFIYVTGTLPDGEQAFVEVHATGSGDCFKSFLGEYPGSIQQCDIGMSSRRIKGQEVEAIEEKTGDRLDRRGDGRDLGTEHPMALDGLAIITHQSNPLTRISFRELHEIYSRRVTDWKDLKEWKSSGGAASGLPISPLRRREPSGTLDFFVQNIQPATAAMRDNNAIPSFVGNDELAANVATLPGGIGFIGQSYPLAPGVKRLQVYNDAAGDESMPADQASFPDPSAVQSGRYPLSRIVYYYTSSFVRNKEVEPFIKFTLSSEGQEILATKGGLMKIEGTRLQLATPRSREEEKPLVGAPSKDDKRQRKVILRMHGSNTIGARCAVYLAINYLDQKRSPKQAQTPIEDRTSELETPEGEKALAHDIMCDVDGDGIWETIEIRPTGSSDAFRGLFNGWCDVGMSSRHISEAEVRDLQEVCGDLSRPRAQFALGLDALAVITHGENRVEQLTLEQVAGAFLGNIPDWAALGGAPGPVYVHSRPERSGTYRFFCDSLLHGRSVVGDARRHAENSAVSAAVAADRQGIAFVPAFATGAAHVLGIGHGKAEGFHRPTPETIRSARYPSALCRYVYLYVPEEKPDAFTSESLVNWETAREFAEMSQSWRGQAIVAACGFVPEISFTDKEGMLKAAEGETPAAYIARLADLDGKLKQGKVTLTPDLREDGEICSRLLFDPGQGRISNESRNTLELKLPAWLQLFSGAVPAGLTAEGWTDDSAAGEQDDAAVSTRRAQAVSEFIRGNLGRKVMSVGKGRSPFPPNDSEENKHVNRRVVLKVTPAAAH